MVGPKDRSSAACTVAMFILVITSTLSAGTLLSVGAPAPSPAHQFAAQISHREPNSSPGIVRGEPVPTVEVRGFPSSWSFHRAAGPLAGPPPLNQSVETVGAGSGPIWAAYDPSDGYVYVENYGSYFGTALGNVTIINGTTVVASPTVGMNPAGAAYDAANGDIYVPNEGSDNVTVLNSTSIVGSVSVQGEPQFDSYDRADREIYVPNCGYDSVSVIQGLSVVATVPAGSCPWNATYDPHHQEEYVLNGLGDTVTVINGTTVAATLTVGSGPCAGIYDPADEEVYISNSNSNNVTVVNGRTIVGTVALGAGSTPCYGGYDPSDHEVYIANYGSNNVSLLSGTRLTGSVAVGQNPITAVYDSRNTHIYVPNGGGPGNITVLNGTRVIGWLGGGNASANAIYVNSSDSIYIPNQGSDNVSVVVRGYGVQFTETGLPNGTAWWVNLTEGVSHSSTGPTVSFTLPNGSYTFVIAASDPSYRAPGGTFTLASIALSMSVDFSRVTYGLVFQESGLPSGTTWSVSIGSSTNSSTSASIGFQEANGTYSYRIGRVPGWTVAAFEGNATVQGAIADIAVDWTRVAYPVTFTEMGLPSATTWWLNVSGQLPISTTSSQIAFVEPNGSYPYSVGLADTAYSVPSGTFAVSGGADAVSVQFTRVAFHVNFTEVGLPAGTNWSVRLGGAEFASTTSTIPLEEVNGSYTYRIADVPGWSTTSYGGTVVVAGTDVSISRQFQEVTYTVTFSESGLAPGTRWSVRMNAETESSTGSVEFVGFSNGTYAFNVVDPSGYVSDPSNGSIVVRGLAVSSTIAFTPRPGSSSGVLLGGPVTDLAVIGVLVAVAVVVTLIVRRRKGGSR